MSWAEYKKKREEQEKSKTSSYQEYNNSNNNSEVSSWQRYKQIREEQEQQQKEITNITRSSAIAPIKTTANLSDTELRKIEKNAGLKAGVLNLNQVQSQQQNFENLQQKGNEILQDKKSDLGIDNGKILKKSSAFKDGYNFGDVSKTALSTAGDVALNIGKGIMNIGEGIGDLATYGIAGIADLTGNKEYAEKLRYNASHMNVVDDMTKPMINAVDKNSILGNKSDEVAQGLGYVAGNTAIAVASGGLGTKLGLSSKIAQTAGSMGTTFTSSMGHGMTEAYQNGATDDEAFAYGLISGVGETGSELMFGGLGKASKAVGLSKGAGELDDIVIGGLTKNIKNKMAKTLVQSGLKATGEGAEEVVSGLISAVGKKVTYMSEEELGQILKDENLAEQFWMGALTSAIAQAPSTMSSIKNGTDYITGEKYNEFQKNDAQKLAQNVQNSTEQQTILNDIKTLQNENTAQLDDMLNNKERVRDILSRNGSFSEQVDKYIANKLPSGDFLYLGETPTVLQNLGLPNNEVILKQSKLKTLMQESNNNTDKLHGLPIETIKKIPEAIANPLNILQSSTDENSVVIITDLADANERPIIASIEVNYDGQIGNIDFLSNRLTSAYGKNNYDRFMKTEIAKGNLLYDIDEGIIKELPATRLQSPKGISSFVDTNNNASTVNNSISQNNNSVKNNTTITNNYAQQTQNDTHNNQNVAPSVANNSLPVGEYTRKKTMNPTEIANLKPENANTTPQLKKKTYKKGNKQSSFLSNIVMDSKFLNEDLRQEMSKEDSIKYYEGITNKGTLESAYNKLQRNGQEEVIKWHTKDSKNATAEDVATGWILLKQYQDNGDYQSAVEVAKKMRDIGTTAGQTVQAYNILSRLTPEGMFYYAQSELDEAYNRMVEGKSKKWIEENQSKFNLTPEETQSILDIMKDVSTMEDGYNKKVKLAEIQKMITDKIPPTAGQSIKAWMRISMLFNPKTQVRNVMGNAVITPVNMFSDSISAGIDKIISKKTGVRTTGNINLKNYGKGFGTGLYQSYNDFKKGINTRNIEGNRFEISEGRSFKNKGIGKALNRVDNLLSFMLDAGDRGFYEATFTNSINNQMLLNKVDTPTQDMIDIATTEALQRTWQDNNKYTQSVLKIRNILNNANIKGYGLGDVLIPFAKTPANLTKAIVDYSPAGLVKTLVKDARILKNSLENGQYTAQVQHRFVQNLGKGMAGTFLYVLSYGLAKAGIATGESDDDKDVKNFMKNSLGISSYSIKIGDKTFSYDWAQPIATPLAIMTNYVKYSKENPDANILEKGISAMNIGTEQLLQQSFMESLNTVLNGNGTTLENLSQAILDLPARAIPTFSKQIADMVDGTQRTTFEYGRPIKSAVNSVVAKIPVVSKTLPASVDTLGNEIQKYGGNNNLWNVMLNPANTNKGHLSKSGEEIYNIYKETGDKTIFPRTAPYYINNKNEKVTMTAEQRNKFQTISGKYVESSLNNLLRDKEYQKLSSEEKANIINEIVSDSYSKAKYDVLNIDSKEYEKLRNTLKNVSASSYYNYKFKTKDMKKDIEKIKVLASSDYDNKEKTALYEQYILSTESKKYPIVKTTNIDITQYLQYKLAEANGKFDSDKKDDGTVTGKSVSGSAKQKRWQYIENMNITYTQKLILYGLECTPNDIQQKQIVNYVKSLPNKTNKEKLEILSQFKGFTIYKDGRVKY